MGSGAVLILRGSENIHVLVNLESIVWELSSLNFNLHQSERRKEAQLSIPNALCVPRQCYKWVLLKAAPFLWWSV